MNPATWSSRLADTSCQNTVPGDDTFSWEPIDRQRRRLDTSDELAISAMDVEPELFTFNESFDANLLDLKPVSPANVAQPSSSSSSSSSACNQDTSMSFMFEHSDEQLLSQLNRLYSNEVDVTETAVDALSLLSFDADLPLVDRNELTPFTDCSEINLLDTANDTLTLSADEQFLDFPVSDDDDDDNGNNSKFNFFFKKEFSYLNKSFFHR